MNLKPNFYVNSNIYRYSEAFTSTSGSIPINYQKLLELVWESFLCRLLNLNFIATISTVQLSVIWCV